MREKQHGFLTRFLLHTTLVAFLASPGTAWAIDFDQSFTGPSGSQAEYFNINKDKRMTIQVNFVGGVVRPGIHHVPDNTHLLEAIALAGGVQPDSDPGKITIRRKRKDNAKFDTIRFDMGDILADRESPYPELRNNDTVMIDSRSHTAENLIMGLSIVGSIVALVSGYLIIANKR